MYRALESSKVRFWFIGRESGGYSERLAPGVGHRNLLRLSLRRGVTAGTCIVPSDAYDVVVVDRRNGGLTVPSAALITNRPGHALLLRPADCLPVVLYTAGEKPVIALIHGGRRELDSDVVERTIDAMHTQFAVKPAGIHAYLGPGIKQSSYRLPREVESTLHHSGWKPHIRDDQEQLWLDDFGFARAELIRSGVLPERISVSTINTATNPRYYSHYEATRYGEPAGMNGCMAVVR